MVEAKPLDARDRRSADLDWAFARRPSATRNVLAVGNEHGLSQSELLEGSATMTLDTYGHLFDDRLDVVGDAMDRARTAARSRH